MTLRRRLALVVVLTAVPLTFVLLHVRAHLKHRSRVEGAVEFARTLMESGGRMVCESFPQVFPGGPGLLGMLGMEMVDGEMKRLPGMPPGFPLPRGSVVVQTEFGEITDRALLDGLEIEGPHGQEILEAIRRQLEKARAAGPEKRGRPIPRVHALSPPHGPRAHHPEGMALWAYHPDLQSSNPRAPPFPEALGARLAAGAPTASDTVERDGKTFLRVATRMAWDEGPCAVVTVERPLRPEEEPGGTLVWGLLGIVGGVLAAVVLAAGPIVKRIRRLQDDVRRSAADGYANQIEVRGSDEIADLARAFNEAGQDVRSHVGELEAREATLRTFVANTTHDVMIPLTVLQGHLAAVRDQLNAGEEIDPSEVRSSLEEAHYLASLIHNLSAVAKLETAAADLVRDEVDLVRLVERVAERHRPLARMRGVQLAFSVPEEGVTTLGDVTLLEQAVSNLVHNAVRYNDTGGHVSVLLEREGDRFVLKVLDDGPGVGVEQIERLTERRFRSAQARTRAPDGNGLGLHIARDVADRHGLTLELRRPEDGGFEVVLRGQLAAGASSPSR